MRHSESVNEVAEALSKAFKKLEPVTKGAENPFFDSKYADIASIYHVIHPALEEAALSIVQGVRRASAEEMGLVLTTRLLHKSGQWYESDVPFIVSSRGKQPGPQEYGSALTYARRYGLMAVLGLAVDDATDDDGNKAQQGAQRQAKQLDQSGMPHGYLREYAKKMHDCAIGCGKPIEAGQIMIVHSEKGLHAHEDCFVRSVREAQAKRQAAREQKQEEPPVEPQNENQDPEDEQAPPKPEQDEGQQDGPSADDDSLPF